MKIKFIGDKKVYQNYTKLGKLIPNESTEIDVKSYFDTQRYSEKEIVNILKSDSNIELLEVNPVIEKKIEKEIEEKKTEVTAEIVTDGRRRGRKSWDTV
jgi:hypothetical protein